MPSNHNKIPFSHFKIPFNHCKIPFNHHFFSQMPSMAKIPNGRRFGRGPLHRCSACSVCSRWRGRRHSTRPFQGRGPKTSKAHHYLGVQLCIILRVIYKYICKKICMYIYIYVCMYYFFIFFSGLYTYEWGNYDWF